MAFQPISLNIIGCGRAARTLVRLWIERGLVRVLGVVNRTLASGAEATAFLGQGTPFAAWWALPQADALLLGVPDQEISHLVDELRHASTIPARSFVFHLSGALGSEVLSPLRSFGVQVASLHPVMTFAEPTRVLGQLSGCVYTLEGDAAPCQTLAQIVELTGGKILSITPEQKPVYHAALVFACNYLVVLVDIGLELLARVGFPSEEGRQAIGPLVEAAMENCFELGPGRSLTGPVARGDAEVVARELDALRRLNPRWGTLYRLLAEEALCMAVREGLVDEGKARVLSKILSDRVDTPDV
ncbi:MAG: DUF2520 domain-containing protein [Thermoguttaceae bacterium]|nr:DUF2520 domain-containing protein [Thermoguttaceae bacterium]MDW8079430.1 DUF2520 domain-containing protein [Thermoguttaceae bacterium]